MNERDLIITHLRKKANDWYETYKSAVGKRAQARAWANHAAYSTAAYEIENDYHLKAK